MTRDVVSVCIRVVAYPELRVPQHAASTNARTRTCVRITLARPSHYQKPA